MSSSQYLGNLFLLFSVRDWRSCCASGVWVKGRSWFWRMRSLANLLFIRFENLWPIRKPILYASSQGPTSNISNPFASTISAAACKVNSIKGGEGLIFFNLQPLTYIYLCSRLLVLKFHCRIFCLHAVQNSQCLETTFILRWLKRKTAWLWWRKKEKQLYCDYVRESCKFKVRFYNFSGRALSPHLRQEFDSDPPLVGLESLINPQNI